MEVRRPIRYRLSYWYGTNGIVTLGPDFLHLYIFFALRQTPEGGTIYSVNEGNAEHWRAETRTYIERLKGSDNPRGKEYSSRYIGSLVADFHRNLLYGGVFLYPADDKDPKKPTGKLRLVTECAPLAFVCEAAGGMASTGSERILDIAPEHIHQRVPFVVGSRKEVEFYDRIVREQNG